MPQRHQDTKNHKEQIFNTLNLVNLGAFEPLWQEIDFSEWTQSLRFKVSFFEFNVLKDNKSTCTLCRNGVFGLGRNMQFIEDDKEGIANSAISLQDILRTIWLK